jgi:ATP-dependent RNA helicase MSS116
MVICVWKVGIPSSKEQYIHRLGRTGRAGKEGQGIIVLSPDESHFVHQLKGLPIDKLQNLDAAPESYQVGGPRRPHEKVWEVALI